jgi:lysozyme
MTTATNPPPVVTPVTNTRAESVHAAQVPRIAGPWDISIDGIHFLEGFEAFKPNLYDVDGHKGQHGNATIGYGHLVHAGPINHSASEAPYARGISKQEGDALLHQDLRGAVRIVNDEVQVPLHQYEFDALVSLAFNMGHKCDDLLELVNTGQYGDVPEKFLTYDKARRNGVLEESTGLKTRREREARMFAEGVYDSHH